MFNNVIYNILYIALLIKESIYYSTPATGDRNKVN